MRETGLDPWVGKIPWRQAFNPLLYSYLENPHKQRSLDGYSLWGRTQVTQHAQIRRICVSITRNIYPLTNTLLFSHPCQPPALGKPSGSMSLKFVDFKYKRDHSICLLCLAYGLPWCRESQESACNAGDRVSSLGWEEPLEKGMVTHSSILSGKFHGQRSLEGYTPRGLQRV